MKIEPIVIGASNCPQTHRLCDWLTRQEQSYAYAERSKVEDATAVDGSYSLPRLITEAGHFDGCSPAKAAEALGFERWPQRLNYDVVIVGGGPAGLSAAIHGAAEGLNTLLLESYAVGGQMSSSQRVENYAGFPEPVNGAWLANRMATQAKRLGAEIIVARSVTGIERLAGGWGVTIDSTFSVKAKVVILAIGAQFRTIGIDGQKKFLGAGVYYGLTDRDVENCGQRVVVVGGGNSAGQAAITFAKQGKDVTLVVRSDSLAHDMSKYLVDEVEANANIQIKYEAQISAVEGHEMLNEVQLTYKDGEVATLECNSVFVFAGNAPETNWLGLIAPRDQHGYVMTAQDDRVLLKRNSVTESVVPLYERGTLFAIGDVRSGSTKRIAVAAAEGASAIALAWKLIHEDKENV